MTSRPHSACFFTTSATASATARASSAALPPGTFCSASNSSTTAGGRGRLPVWVVRILSVLRFIARGRVQRPAERAPRYLARGRGSLHLDQADLVDQAVGGDRIAVGGDVHVAHEVAAARDRPALEFLRLRIEAHDGVGFGAGLVVPERALGEDDAVGLRLRAARRQPFLVLAGCQIEA